VKTGIKYMAVGLYLLVISCSDEHLSKNILNDSTLPSRLNYTYWAGYKRGQVNALSNIISYELVTHPDGTRTWEEINKAEVK
jgi:hypothetical protein